LNNPVKYQDPSGHMPTDGCQTEGCATDEDWAENFIKGIQQTTDLTDPNDNPKGQLTLHFYQWTLDHYTPEVGSITPGDVLRDAWHAAATHIGARGLSAADDWGEMQRMGLALVSGFLYEESQYAQNGGLGSALPGGLSSSRALGMRSPEEILMPGGQPIGAQQGRKATIRTLQTEQEMRELFDALKMDAKPYTPKNPYDGQMYELPNGGIIGWRNTSVSGGPAIDVAIPGIPIKKIHLP